VTLSRPCPSKRGARGGACTSREKKPSVIFSEGSQPSDFVCHPRMGRKKKNRKEDRMADKQGERGAPTRLKLVVKYLKSALSPAGEQEKRGKKNRPRLNHPVEIAVQRKGGRSLKKKKLCVGGVKRDVKRNQTISKERRVRLPNESRKGKCIRRESRILRCETRTGQHTQNHRRLRTVPATVTERG